MHIAEGFLPPLHAVAWAGVSLPFVAHGVRAVRRVMAENEQTRLLLGAAGAFTFLLSAIKLPSITGSSSHPTGTGLGAIALRPPVMAVLGTVVLVLQALLLAHGGLTTLGANVFSFAVAGPWVAFWVHRALRRVHPGAALVLAVAAANLATYLVTSCQLALAHPDPHSGVLGALARFASLFALTQIPLAVIEGLIALALVRAIREWAPDLVIGTALDHGPVGRAPDPAGPVTEGMNRA